MRFPELPEGDAWGHWGLLSPSPSLQTCSSSCNVNGFLPSGLLASRPWATLLLVPAPGLPLQGARLSSLLQSTQHICFPPAPLLKLQVSLPPGSPAPHSLCTGLTSLCRPQQSSGVASSPSETVTGYPLSPEERLTSHTWCAKSSTRRPLTHLWPHHLPPLLHSCVPAEWGDPLSQSKPPSRPLLI